MKQTTKLLLGRLHRSWPPEVMDPDLQAKFNVIKGIVPPRLEVPDTTFDACGR